MVVKADQDRVKTLLKDTITLLCKNGLSFETEFSIDALIGITLDKDDVFLVSIKELVRSENAKTASKRLRERNEMNSESDVDSDGSSGASRNSSESRRRKRRKRKIKLEISDSNNPNQRAESSSHFESTGNDIDGNEPPAKKSGHSYSDRLQVVSKLDPDDADHDNDFDDGAESSGDDITFIKQEIDENWTQQQNTDDYSNYANMEDSGGMGSLMGNNLVPVGHQEGNALWEQTLMQQGSRLFQPGGPSTSTVSSGIGDSMAQGENQVHKQHMDGYLSTVFASKKSSIIPEKKYDLILQHLRDPTSCQVDPNFRHWVKVKQFSAVDLSGNGVTDVLVAPVPHNKTKKLRPENAANMLRVLSSKDIYRVTKQIHEEVLNHAGYKKLMEFASQHYIGLTRSYAQEFTKTCPECLLKSQKSHDDTTIQTRL